MNLKDLINTNQTARVVFTKKSAVDYIRDMDKKYGIRNTWSYTEDVPASTGYTITATSTGYTITTNNTSSDSFSMGNYAGFPIYR